MIPLIPPDQPAEGEIATPVRPSAETLALMAARRSTSVMRMAEPGPNVAQLKEIARLAARVPDHGKLGPWRFVAMSGEARARAGDAVAQTMHGEEEQRRAIERARFLRAPACLMVVSTAAAHAKIPEWEQQLSAGAVCFAALLAGHAMGFAGGWLTEWPAYAPAARAALGLAEHERIAGFLYFGTPTEAILERVRPDFEARFSVL